jgi:hypothetical protein
MTKFWTRAALSSCALYLCVSPALAQDIPTGAARSPLFGAQPFTQKMLMFEEFGVRAMPTAPNQYSSTFAQPASCQGAPLGWQVDKMIKQVLWPLPTREANTTMPNPWAAKVGACIGQTLQSSAIEGRPAGELYAHQRFDEFAPKAYFSSVQTGARVNNGARDAFGFGLERFSGYFAGQQHHAVVAGDVDVGILCLFLDPRGRLQFDALVFGDRADGTAVFRHHNAGGRGTPDRNCGTAGYDGQQGDTGQGEQFAHLFDSQK